MPTIDANGRSAALAVTNDGSLLVSPWLVDPVTGYLMIEIVSGTSSGIAPTRDTVDANSRDIALAVTDDANEDIRPFATTTEGYLLLDVTF